MIDLENLHLVLRELARLRPLSALGDQLGRFVLVLNCDEAFDFQAIGCFLFDWNKNNQPQLIYWRIYLLKNSIIYQLGRLCIWLKECKSLSWVQELLIFRNSKDVCNVSRRVVRRRCQTGRLILLDRLWKIQST